MNEVALSGSAYEIGEQYGEMLKEGGFRPEPITDEQRQFVADCVPLVEDAAPAILDELRGIADAGDWSLERIRVIPLALGWDAGCTVVALSGELTADGTPIFGRNYDFSTEFADYATLYRTDPDKGLAHVGCSDHWTGRHDGVNEAGLAVGHSFVPHRGLEPGVMFALAARTVLETCESVDDGVTFLERVPHARNTNFLLADSTGSIALVEASPDEVTTTVFDGMGVATNHFQTPAMAVHEPDDDGRSDSDARLTAIHDWTNAASGPVQLTDLQRTLANPETGICSCVNESDKSSVETLWSWTAILDPPEAHLASGRPDKNPYVPVMMEHNR
ncbi:C45 family autoproteolytic acyltransferase/hydolase [Haladaptatus sp. NG-SE-30]